MAIVYFAKAHAVGPDQMAQQALRHFGDGNIIKRNKSRLAQVRAQLDLAVLVDRNTLGPIGQQYTHHDKESGSDNNDSNYHSSTGRFKSHCTVTDLLQVSLIIHLLVENTIYAKGAIVALYVKDDVMPYLKSPKP